MLILLRKKMITRKLLTASLIGIDHSSDTENKTLTVEPEVNGTMSIDKEF